MAHSFKLGQPVKWKWGAGWGHGIVRRRFTQRVERTINGSEIIRNATDEEPAYLIEQADGGEVLKSRSEVEAS
jgi:hypothetical protein